jgi:diketogulonate reductase-like aldo/keto reductase
MPWTEHKLNDGHSIPGIGFGSSGHPLEKTADDINLAIECGFDHIDTAQSE